MIYDSLNKVYKTSSGKIEVEIGDSKQLDFKPQVKLMKWKNEANFSMRAEEKQGATTVLDNGIVKYQTTDYEVHQYTKQVDGEDGFEFEWVLKSRPVSNVLSATIQIKNLKFFYQPELTEEEKLSGSVRPENVVGSYAVYHETNRDNDYETGKAFHIYRPEAVDSQGTKVWCDLNIDTKSGILTVTVPEKFLDKAVYPVIVDPTFGYNTVGATDMTQTGFEYYYGNSTAITFSGKAMYVYAALRVATNAVRSVNWGLSDTTTTYGNLIGTVTNNNNISTSFLWYKSNGGAANISSGTTYYATVSPYYIGGNDTIMAYDSGTSLPGGLHNYVAWFPDTTRVYSVYVVYLESGVATSATTAWLTA